MWGNRIRHATACTAEASSCWGCWGCWGQSRAPPGALSGPRPPLAPRCMATSCADRIVVVRGNSFRAWQYLCRALLSPGPSANQHREDSAQKPPGLYRSTHGTIIAIPPDLPTRPLAHPSLTPPPVAFRLSTLEPAFQFDTWLLTVLRGEAYAVLHRRSGIARGTRRTPGVGHPRGARGPCHATQYALAMERNVAPNDRPSYTLYRRFPLAISCAARSRSA